MRLYTGSKAGLGQPTAICDLPLANDRVLGEAQQQNLRKAMLELTRSDPFFGIEERDWPGAFVVSSSIEGRLSEWVVAVTVTLQRLACEFSCKGQVLRRDGRRVVVALPWTRKAVLESALGLALEHVPRLVRDFPGSKPHFLKACSEWVDGAMPGGLAPVTLRFAHAAVARGMPVMARPGAVIQIGWGRNGLGMYGSFSGRTSNLATRWARIKAVTKELLADACLPVPRGVLLHSAERLEKAAAQMGWPLVVKPNALDQGALVVANITSMGVLHKAFSAALPESKEGVIVEQHVQGDDHRLLVVGGRLLMATRRVNGGVTGDGISTISELVEKENLNPLRGTHKRNIMIRLDLDGEALEYLKDQGLTPSSVPEMGVFVPLRRTANISTGGTAVDVTDVIHPDNRVLAERAAQVVGLDIAGVDFICPDICRSWQEVGGAICEVNAQPGLRPHWLSDPARDINGEMLDWLFPGHRSRIPVALVLGGTTAAESAHRLHQAWGSDPALKVGIASARGVWVGGDRVSDDARSRLRGPRALLVEPGLDAAIMALDYGDIERFGHPCDRYGTVTLIPEATGKRSPEQDRRNEMQKLTLLARGEAVVVDAREPFVPRLLSTAGNRRVVLVVQGDDVERIRARHGSGVREMVFAATEEGESRVRYWARGVVQDVVSVPAGGAGQGLSLRGLLFAVATALAGGLAIDAMGAMTGDHFQGRTVG